MIFLPFWRRTFPFFCFLCSFSLAFAIDCSDSRQTSYPLYWFPLDTVPCSWSPSSTVWPLRKVFVINFQKVEWICQNRTTMLPFIENQLSLRRIYLSASYIQGDRPVFVSPVLDSRYRTLLHTAIQDQGRQFKTSRETKRKIPTSAPDSRKGGHCLPIISSAKNLELEASRSSTFIIAVP